MLDQSFPVDSEIPECVHVSRNTLDTILPLRLQVDENGTIVDAGRTFRKLLPNEKLLGEPLANFLRLKRPRHKLSYKRISELVGQKLVFETALGESFTLQAMVIELDAPSHWIINFSLGSDLTDVIERFNLHSKDFCPIDSTIDLMQVAAMQSELLSTSRDLTAKLEASRQDAERRALTDELTKLPNRRGFRQHLKGLCRGDDGEDIALNILHIDLDNFKNINDRYGHAIGDEVLIKAAEIIKSILRPEDFVARTGGDEFVVVLSDDLGLDGSELVAERIVARLSEPFSVDGYTCQIGASVGLNAGTILDLDNLDQLIIDADRALYEAKNSGRGQLRTFDHRMRSRYDELSALGIEMVDAIEADQFTAYYQPKVSVEHGKLWGVEALARWHHPKLGTLSAGQFLNAAERGNLVSRIDEIVMHKAFDAVAAWESDGLFVPYVSINVTAAKLGDPRFVEMLLSATARAGILPSRVGLEVLETVLIEDSSQQLISTIERMSELGFKIELDDFGTGHASISNLRRIPVDVVKIDRSLVQGIDTDDGLRRITASVVELLNNLDITPLAEGVETAPELSTLAQLNCAVVQGYHLAKPLPAEQLRRWAMTKK